MRWLPFALLLASCATASPPTVDVKTVCLPRPTYTPAQERAIGQALAALPPGNALIGAMADFTQMLLADKACLASNKGPTK